MFATRTACQHNSARNSDFQRPKDERRAFLGSIFYGQLNFNGKGRGKLFSKIGSLIARHDGRLSLIVDHFYTQHYVITCGTGIGGLWGKFLRKIYKNSPQIAFEVVSTQQQLPLTVPDLVNLFTSSLALFRPRNQIPITN